MRQILATAIILLSSPSLTSLTYAQPSTEVSELANLGLEDLMQIEVSSVSKKEEALLQAPAAVFVLSSEDIRRSGATSIPEALTLVPGLFVAHINGNTWSISSRGFSGEYANKLLVLVDGRSVYTPLFSGVYWDVQDMPIEDIERIEVIRGPGATLWGANAVSGVINIISKSSTKTKGSMLSTTVGNEDRVIGTARYGAALSENSDYRVDFKYQERADQQAIGGGDGHDSWDQLRGSFRSDTKIDPHNDLTVQGDIYSGNSRGQYLSYSPFEGSPAIATSPGDVGGGNLLSRWNRKISDRSNLQVQSYYDRTYRDAQGAKEARNTFDGDMQYRFGVGESHDVMIGTGYRFTQSSLDTYSFTPQFSRDSKQDDLYSGFLQDDITLIPSKVRFILGSKIEHNDYTGFEYQPSARVLWTPTTTDSFWASISRAVRTPSQADATVRYGVGPVPNAPEGTPSSVVAMGNYQFESEDVLSYELGYRSQILPTLTLDNALFYNKYTGLRGSNIGDPTINSYQGQPYLELPLSFANTVDAHTYGGETSVSYKPFEFMTLKQSYSFIQITTEDTPNSVDLAQRESQGLTPQNQLQSWISLDLPHNIEVDAIFKYYDSLPTAHIGSYWGCDLRIGYALSKSIALSLVGQNLCNSAQLEFVDSVSRTIPTEIERAYYGKVIITF